jgi:hypothetical protein
MIFGRNSSKHVHPLPFVINPSPSPLKGEGEGAELSGMQQQLF